MDSSVCETAIGSGMAKGNEILTPFDFVSMAQNDKGGVGIVLLVLIGSIGIYL
jgi:hypothetical protein